MNEYIKKYIDQGCAVFPCNPDKSPLTKNGFHDSTTDIDLLNKLFFKKDLLIGFPTGEKNKVLVIDFDINKRDKITEEIDSRTVDELKEELEDMIGEPLPDTFMVETMSGGMHYYYQMPSDLDLRSGSRVFDKSLSIDLRANGAYVIAPNGDNYFVYDDVDDQGVDNLLERCAELPQAYIDALQKRKSDVQNSENLPDNILPPEEVHEIRSALSYISSDDRDLWVKIGMSLKSTGSRTAYGLWNDWSRTSDKYNPDDMEKRWDTLKPNDLSIASLFHEAKQNGWQTTYERVNKQQSLPEKTVEMSDIMPSEQSIKKIQEEFKKKPFPPELLRPPGLVGDMIDYILSKSIKEQPIFALSAALCAVGALAGRKVQTISGTRTNIYCLNVGESGCGKEAPRTAIRAMFSAAGCSPVASVDDLASDSAIVSSLEHNESQVFLLDEIGRFIETANSGPSYLQKINDVLLKLYSSAKSEYHGKSYADAEKKTKLEQPNLCILGTTVPKTLYKGLSYDNLDDGFLSRMLIFETDTHRPRKDRRKNLLAEPPKFLVEKIKKLYRKPINMHPVGNIEGITKPMPQVVRMNDNAIEILVDFEEHIEDYRLELVDKKKIDAIYNRTGELAEQIALIVATGMDIDNPVITEKEIMYGIGIAKFIADHMSYIAENYVARNDLEHEVKRILQLVRQNGCVSLAEITRNTQNVHAYVRSGILDTLKDAHRIKEHSVIRGDNLERFYTAI